jgi:hypothetical protein
MLPECIELHASAAPLPMHRKALQCSSHMAVKLWRRAVPTNCPVAYFLTYHSQACLPCVCQSESGLCRLQKNKKCLQGGEVLGKAGQGSHSAGAPHLLTTSKQGGVRCLVEAQAARLQHTGHKGHHPALCQCHFKRVGLLGAFEPYALCKLVVMQYSRLQFHFARWFAARRLHILMQAARLHSALGVPMWSHCL